MLSDKLKNTKVILASQSPRRKKLLEGLNVTFTTMIRNVDESYPYDLPKQEIAEYLAKKKAVAYSDLQEDDTIIITADTVVVVDEEILEKPANEQEAANMLSKLSDRSHQVITGVCVRSKSHTESFSVSTKVYFKKLTVKEIYHYVQKYEPFDKAGSYGIQEWIGYVGVYKIEGSYFNVMGLPVFELQELLMGWDTNENA